MTWYEIIWHGIDCGYYLDLLPCKNGISRLKNDWVMAVYVVHSKYTAISQLGHIAFSEFKVFI